MNKTPVIAVALVLLGVLTAVATSCLPAAPTPPTGALTPPLNPTSGPAPEFTPASPPTLTDTPVATISVAELKVKLEGDHRPVLLDVRTRADFDAGHINGALSLPLAEIPDRYGEVPRGVEIIVYAGCA